MIFSRRALLTASIGALAGCTHAPMRATAMDAALEVRIAAGRIPGSVVLIGRRGRILSRSVLGYLDVASKAPMREDALFRWYSMSKPITSAAIMILAERGALRIDQAAQEILPELRDMRVYAGGEISDMRTAPLARPITIADLLTHTSGITYHFTGETPVHQYYRTHGVMRDTPVGRRPTDAPPAPDLDELVRRIGKAPLLHQPGAHFSYSYSTTVLGAVVERATGERLDTALRELLFDPLGMRDATFFVGDDDLARFVTNYALTPDGMVAFETPQQSDYRSRTRLLDGGGALAGTAADYYRFARMIAGGGAVDGKRIMSGQSLAAMLTPRVHVDGLGGPTAGYWFSYGLQVGDAASESVGQMPANAVGWSGSGNTFFWARPATGDIAVFMTHVITPPGFEEDAQALRRIVSDGARTVLS